VASREQAVVDALAEPNWIIHGNLLAEILGAFTDTEVARTTSGVLDRTTAAAQRLGYLHEEAGRPLPTSWRSSGPSAPFGFDPRNGLVGRIPAAGVWMADLRTRDAMAADYQAARERGEDAAMRRYESKRPASLLLARCLKRGLTGFPVCT
jgi:hypothetical protein